MTALCRDCRDCKSARTVYANPTSNEQKQVVSWKSDPVALLDYVLKDYKPRKKPEAEFRQDMHNILTNTDPAHPETIKKNIEDIFGNGSQRVFNQRKFYSDMIADANPKHPSLA